MTIKWTGCPALVTAGIFIAMSGATAQESHMMKGGGDTKFAMEAAQGGMVEVELGKIAAQKGTSPQVKQFGQRMVDDHSKAGDELKAVAAKDNITLPTELDAKHKAMVDKFSAMSAGAGFDKMYVQNMVKDHQKDVADFEKEASGGTNADLKGFAAKTLPTLQDHLKMIQETQSSMMHKTTSRM